MMDMKIKGIESFVLVIIIWRGYLIEENELEFGFFWVVVLKYGNNVCMKCLLVSKDKLFFFFVIGGCGIYRRVYYLFMVLGLVYLNKLFICLNWRGNCIYRLYKWSNLYFKGFMGIYKEGLRI